MAVTGKTVGYLIFLIPLAFFSCLRLDSNLFNIGEKIQSYQLDNYKGEKEISDLPSSYSVNQDLVSIFTLQSDNNGNEAKIYAIYIGDKTRIGKDTVILYCHGNKNHMDNYWNRAKLLYHTGAKGQRAVLMMITGVLASPPVTLPNKACMGTWAHASPGSKPKD